MQVCVCGSACAVGVCVFVCVCVRVRALTRACAHVREKESGKEWATHIETFPSWAEQTQEALNQPSLADQSNGSCPVFMHSR